MQRRAREVNAPADMTRYAMMKGLRPELRSWVMRQNPTTTDELLEAAKVAEATEVETTPSATSEILDAIRRLELRATTPVDDQRRPTFRPSSPAPKPRREAPRPDRRVRFDDRRAPTGRGYFGPKAPVFNPLQPAPVRALQINQLPEPTWYGSPLSPPGPDRWWERPSSRTSDCTNCARQHPPGNCPAFGKICRSCGKRNHFAVCCRSRPRPRTE